MTIHVLEKLDTQDVSILCLFCTLPIAVMYLGPFTFFFFNFMLFSDYSMACLNYFLWP